jgi:hypothetical protein
MLLAFLGAVVAVLAASAVEETWLVRFRDVVAV